MEQGVLMIRGDISGEWRGNIERCLRRAMTSLELDRIDVEVTASDRVLPKDRAATARRGRIWIRQALLDRPLVATAALLEQAARCKLIEEGVSGTSADFADVLVHQFFAAWYAFSELLPTAPHAETLFDDTAFRHSLPTPEHGDDLGALLGASTAGVEAAQLQAEAWRASRLAEPGIRAIADQLTELAAGAPSPPSLARAIAAYRRTG